MWKTLGIALSVLLLGATCLAQTSYKGLTPGKSTPAEVERVLGRPVRGVSATLIEYRPQPLTGRIYVQYRREDSVIERIEFLCRLVNSTCNDFLKSLSLRLPENNESAKFPADGSSQSVVYYAPPLYLTIAADEDDAPARVAFYSRELYAAAVTKAFHELGMTDVEADDPGYEDIKGVVKLRAADSSLRPIAGASVPFCWAPYFNIC